MSDAAYAPRQNHLLAALPETDFERVQPCLSLTWQSAQGGVHPGSRPAPASAMPW
jgi:hypothetical protein